MIGRILTLLQIDTIEKLMENLPQLESKEELDSALTLIEEAKKLVLTFQTETKESMDQIQNNIKYLNATHTQSNTKIDIKS